MGNGLPKSACRSRLQTAAVLLRSKGVVVNDCGKGVPSGRQVSVEEMSESKPFDDASLIRLKRCRNHYVRLPEVIVADAVAEVAKLH